MAELKQQIKIMLAKCLKCNRKVFLMAGILILIICLIFLGNILWQSINDTRLIASLQQQVATQVVDMKMWQEIKKGVELKKQPPAAAEKLKGNPFE
ncbi:hypothetical protein CO134_03315 [Candidatus Kuenenbacteria bacterium CG_4_9_14_3_um_filter_39_14]|uniref:Uncharacterized protein n=3 Tax=Candidatus Kueneniibacteriota TaxID=1752740 RepID=A0A2M7MHX6_9BACT|nr:MAG: hypothetical protein COZ26_00740 [Candidatus Kuenenbacteria bacterium CG_4_10_14_3_um_filter_39_14]PJA91830.1 MAG: hypothetical protein CO134_03315 [Candidatus Kuenenbacteria bacterium CG_4_9_14_3_um_filter_39_14]